PLVINLRFHGHKKKHTIVNRPIGSMALPVVLRVPVELGFLSFRKSVPNGRSALWINCLAIPNERVANLASDRRRVCPGLIVKYVVRQANRVECQRKWEVNYAKGNNGRKRRKGWIGSR